MKILLIEDNLSLAKIIKMMLEAETYSVDQESDGLKGYKLFEKNRDYDLVITDLRLPGLSGIDILNGIVNIDKNVPIIIITAYGNISEAVNAIKKGAYDYVTKPFENDEFLLKVNRALEERRLKKENLTLKNYIKNTLNTEIIGKSAKIKELIENIKIVAPTNAPVLILGESGVGKELVVKQIHILSDRAEKPFVSINCAAIPDNLFESELFGYKKAAFTGAEKDKKGRIEEADKGTLFLDEVSELPLGVQAKLLRFLQQGEIMPLGTTTPTTVDVRIVAATNRNLMEMMKENKFREDLYFRLNVFPVFVPPLRERKEDIPLLLKHFMTKYGYKNTTIEDSVIEKLINYNWPGNIRELENMVYRLCIVSKGDKIKLEHLPIELRNNTVSEEFNLPEGSFNLEEFEKEVVQKAIAKFNGNKTKAAEYLAMPRHILIYRLEKWGIK